MPTRPSPSPQSERLRPCVSLPVCLSERGAPRAHGEGGAAAARMSRPAGRARRLSRACGDVRGRGALPRPATDRRYSWAPLSSVVSLVVAAGAMEGARGMPRGSRRVVLVEASLRVFPIFSFSSNSCLPSASAAITVRSFPAASAVITPRRGWAPSKKLDRREGVRAHVRLPLQAPSRIQAPDQCSRCTARRCVPSSQHPVPLVLEIDPPAHALADHTDGVRQCGCH